MQEEENYSGFGQRLKAVRKHLSMKQEEFSQRLNLSVTRISEIENGKSFPGFHFLANLAREFNVNLHYLILGEGEMIQQPVKENVTIGDLKSVIEILLNRIEDKKERELLQGFFSSDIVKFQLLSAYSELLLDKGDKIKAQIEQSQEIEQ